jgi:hypothetical protein
MKKNALTIDRVEEQLLPLYVDPRADGTCVTDVDSFAQDIIADVLIWASSKGEDIETILRLAADHADYEVTNDPEQE